MKYIQFIGRCIRKPESKLHDFQEKMIEEFQEKTKNISTLTLTLPNNLNKEKNNDRN